MCSEMSKVYVLIDEKSVRSQSKQEKNPKSQYCYLKYFVSIPMKRTIFEIEASLSEEGKP